jgi:hypothetical protein
MKYLFLIFYISIKFRLVICFNYEKYPDFLWSHLHHEYFMIYTYNLEYDSACSVNSSMPLELILHITIFELNIHVICTCISNRAVIFAMS